MKTIVNNTLFDMPYSENNTDDEQEDLPYDGDLQNVFTLTSSRMSYCSQEKPDLKAQLPQKNINLASLPRKKDMEFTVTTGNELLTWDVSSSGRYRHISNSKISDVLLRHFPIEDLTSPCHLIDSETIPDISFTESFDETIINKSKSSENTRISLPKEEEKNNLKQKLRCESDEKNWDFIHVEQFAIDDSVNPNCEIKDCKENNSQFLTQKEYTINEELSCTSAPKDEDQEQKYFMEKNGSPHNHKYSQRQVHYQLPDFSKIAPKVKIPRGSSNNKPSPIIKRTKSSPNWVGKSAIVKDVLEAMNSLESVAVKNQEEKMRIAELDQQLEMLTEHAEAQNHIDHLRFNAKILPSSNSNRTSHGIKGRGSGIASELSKVPLRTVPVKPMLCFSQSPLSELQSGEMNLPLADAARPSTMNPLLLQKATEERMLSEMLKDQTEELKAKVEIFSKCMSEDVLPAEECNQLLKLLKGQLDQLEQNYLTMKEKHCALRLQSYKHSSTSFVEFDPDRKVEGEIFKLGMLLEDIKENIDKTCNPHSTPFVISSSFTSCKSVSSSCSSCSESPVVSSISNSPQKTAVGTHNKNEKYGEDRGHFMEEKTYQQPNQSSGCHLFQPQNLSYWEMRSPPPANPCSTNNPGSTTVGLTTSKEQGSPDYPSNHCFLEGLGNSSKEHNIIIHPRLKMQLSSKQTCLCSSNRKPNREKTDCEQFSIFLEGKAADFDLSGSDTEETSFCDRLDSSHSETCLEQKMKNHGPNQVSSQKADTVLQKIYTDKQPEEFIDRLCHRQNLHIPQTRYSRMHDIIILSPQYLSHRSIYGRKSTSKVRSRHTEDTDTKILSSTLDHVIQTANSLKKTSEHMMQVVSEDLAKAKIQTLSSVTGSQHCI
ncbi:hypothetical protein JD844_017468 [Phrynosoma platyrhinos]|uniref:Protein AKNAD1 n=1 Tax=Phrynosoma platyrhinos TaxID=52577 RepID=A0ABQ7SM55_PHRPL|nr:hypothetical protein JD844_017468 [Phrynosoma platyrhinos]